MNPRLAASVAAGVIAYAAWLWLTYVSAYRQSRSETIARLLSMGADKKRSRLLREEGITEHA